MAKPGVPPEQAAFDTLRSVPSCVAVTLRRMQDGHPWDILLRRIDGLDEAMRAYPYTWELREADFVVAIGKSPYQVLTTESFATPEAALAAAEASLAWGKSYEERRKD